MGRLRIDLAVLHGARPVAPIEAKVAQSLDLAVETDRRHASGPLRVVRWSVRSPRTLSRVPSSGDSGSVRLSGVGRAVLLSKEALMEMIGPIVVLGVILGGIGGIIWLIFRAAFKAPSRDLGDEHEYTEIRPMPATARQLQYIAALLQERETEGMVIGDVDNVEQASALIDELKTRPRRK